MRFLFVIISVIIFQPAFAQLKPENHQKLKLYEDTIRAFANTMIQSEDFENRSLMAYNIIPRLRDALKVPGSFYYPFDSLRGISVIYPEKKDFRIFTWALQLENGTYRHFGAIQMNSKKTEVYPLIDASLFIQNQDTIVSNDYWYGALYYNIISKKHKGKTYHYLFGLDGNDQLSTKKLIDVLHFEKGKPVFGAPHFVINKDDKDSVVNRFVLEYKADAAVSLNYFSDYGGRIIFDHVFPKNPLSVGVYSTYIPDGTYEEFVYDDKKGKWMWVEKAWEGGINEMDNPPVPKPVDFDKEKQQNKQGGK